MTCLTRGTVFFDRRLEIGVSMLSLSAMHG